MLVIGHRGAGGTFAENTLGAMRHALACGADGVELDVRLLDEALIVLHDETLERTTDGHGHYKRYALAGLRALRTAGGEPVPLLDEALAAIGPHALVNVEVKEAGIAAQVVGALERHLAHGGGDPARVLLSAFDRQTTAELAHRRGAMQVGVLYRDEPLAAVLARAAALGAWSVHVPLEELSAATIAAIHAGGRRALVYTVNAPADIARCHRCGVDGVFSDYPERVIAFRRRRAPAGAGGAA